MARYVRIVASPTADNEDAAPLYFDVAIDSDNQIANERTIFGFQGDMNSRFGRSFPFILYSDGRSDFGEEYDTADRFGEIDLREGKIFKGRLFRSHGNGFDERFRITQIIVLAEG
jgi:hypothetical protein